jgi:predicted ATPase/DNA-binding SARP family transcriptional activator
MSEEAVSAEPVGVRFGLLGPVVVVDAGGEVMPVGPGRWRAVLAALLVHRDVVLSVDRLVSLLWGATPPATAATMVHGAVAGLRRVIEPPGSGRERSVLVTWRGGYVLRAAPAQVDASRFEGLLAEGRGLVDTVPARASALLGQALALWRGPALEGVEEPFARDAAARWDELRLGCVEERMRAELAVGHHLELVAELQDLVGRYPLRERLSAQLMHALYRCGRQADALGAFQRLARTLRVELGLEPGPGVRRLQQAILQQSPSLDVGQPVPARVVGAGPGRGLPAPVSTFIGRAVARAEVGKLIGAHRLVTLTGTGGAGKTRLALEIARARAASSVRVWMVELAVLRTPNLIEETVAEALGVRPESGHSLTQTLVASLSGYDTLIVLDNCEHLLQGCATLAHTLLSGTERLRLLTTSREPLGVPGEVVYPLEPLELVGELADWRRIGDCEAVRLFCERATAVRPGFALTEDNATPVLEVCRRLDGLPLALELAAARVSSMPVSLLVRRLQDRFSVLDSATRPAGPGRRGLSDTVGWSYELLEEPERVLFTHLSVFPAAFTLEAAAHVAGGQGVDRDDVASLLSRLVDRSVLSLIEPGSQGNAAQPRYRMLETTRQYAKTHLDSAAGAQLRARHALWCVSVAEQAEPHLSRAQAGSWLQRLAAERDHFRVALEWAFSPGGDPRVGARLVACLFYPWELWGSRQEGLRWVHAGLQVFAADQPRERLALLAAGALLHAGRADFDTCAALAVEQVELARATGARGWEGDGLGMVATMAWARGEFDRALPLYRDAVSASLAGGDVWRASLEESQLARLHRDRDKPEEAMTVALRALERARELGEPLACGLALDVLASLEKRRGQLRGARRLAQDSLEQYGLIGYVEGEASALQRVGRLALEAHEPDAAREAFERALRRSRRIGHREGAALALEGLATVAAVADDDERAVLLLGAAGALRRELGLPAAAADAAHHQRLREGLADKLGQLAAEQTLHRGATLGVDQFLEHGIRAAQPNHPPT